MASERPCIVCLKSNSKLCSVCKDVYYCSVLCQKSDWRAHKLFCAEYSSFKMSNRPSAKHFLGIIFPANDSKPKGVWVMKGEFDQPDVDALLGGNDAIPQRYPIKFNELAKRNIPDVIYISFRDEFLTDGSEPNKCIRRITAPRPGVCYEWRGPMVAYGMVGLDLDPTDNRDLTMTDFKHIVDYFLSYAYDPSPTKGVRINCVSDQGVLGRPHFEAVDVSHCDVIFTADHDTSGIATRIGLPIFTRQYPPDPKWKHSTNARAFVNQDATFLHLCCDPKSKCWGWAPMRWQNKVGSILVVRQDQKPLLPSHVEALCNYCRSYLQPLFEDSVGAGLDPENPISKKSVLAKINRVTYSQYYDTLLRQKREKGEDTSYPGPFASDSN